jgi:hypothetical protein
VRVRGIWPGRSVACARARGTLTRFYCASAIHIVRPLQSTVATQPQYVGVDRRFDYRRATNKYEWRVHYYGVRLMPELYEHLNPMTPERALRTARKLAEDLRGKGFGVANGVCTGSQ